MAAPTELPSAVFKECPCCGKVWRRREHFLTDPSLTMIGYQMHANRLELGLFLFDHGECGTSLSIHVSAVSDLCPGPAFAERLTGTDDCPAYCLREDELRPCKEQCECAYVREIIQILRGRGFNGTGRPRSANGPSPPRSADGASGPLTPDDDQGPE
jgi:hypothetical protein